MNYDVIKLSFWKYSQNSIDPFESKILIPLITYTNNYTFAETRILKLSD